MGVGYCFIVLNPSLSQRAHCAISRSSQCSTTGVTKAVVCAILSGMVHIKEPLLLIGKSSHVVAAGFFSYYLSGPLLYVRRHITVNKMC